jgi:hypothetical protein
MAKKRKLEFSDRSREENPNYVSSKICVWCGKPLDPDTHKRHYMEISKRFYPVCDEDCEQEVRGFVEKDRKYKPVIYIVLFFAVIVMFFASFAEWRDIVIAPSLIVCALAFILFPYPFSNPDTFTILPMRRSRVASRIVGAVLLAVGIPLLVSALMTWG